MTNSTSIANPTTPQAVGKLITYMALAAVSILLPSIQAGGDISPVNVVNAAVAVIGTIPVYYARPEQWMKTLVAAALGGLQALVLIVANATSFAQVTPGDWIAVIVAGLAAIGVAYVPNRQAPITATQEGDVFNITNVEAPPAS